MGIKIFTLGAKKEEGKSLKGSSAGEGQQLQMSKVPNKLLSQIHSMQLVDLAIGNWSDLIFDVDGSGRGMIMIYCI